MKKLFKAFVFVLLAGVIIIDLGVACKVATILFKFGWNTPFFR